MCAVLFFVFVFLWWGGAFHRGKQTERSTLNTRAGRWYWTSHLLLSTMTWLHALHLQYSPFQRISMQHFGRKQSHCIDIKTSSRFSSTKGSAGISGIVTVCLSITGPQWVACVLISPQMLCKINPFRLRKKLVVTSCFEVAIYILQWRSLCEQLSDVFFFSFFVITRRHFTLFTIYLTPEKWYISFVVFNVLPQWWKMAKVTCVSLHEWIIFFSISRGKFYTSIYIYRSFSCCQWKQKILFKVSVWLVEVAVPKLLMIGRKQTPSSVEWF